MYKSQVVDVVADEEVGVEMAMVAEEMAMVVVEKEAAVGKVEAD